LHDTADIAGEPEVDHILTICPELPRNAAYSRQLMKAWRRFAPPAQILLEIDIEIISACEVIDPLPRFSRPLAEIREG
jgi:hypothetical protein